jgi:DNA-binding NarL/FixJ family response regulator
VRVLLCDNHRLYAEPLAAALERRGHEVFLAATKAEALRLLDLHEPDVCITELRIPDTGGAGLVAQLSGRQPLRPVLVLSGSSSVGDRAAAAAAGAAAVIAKDEPISVIFDTLDRIAAGGVSMGVPPPRPGSDGKAQPQTSALLEPLTRREGQVLRRLVEAEDTEQIARSLGVAPSTVRTHLQSAFVKLGANNRLQAVALALEAGLGGELAARRPLRRR